jgi:MoCo/4Fe-4S cofactor protein with predicted Tat translocation signal
MTPEMSTTMADTAATNDIALDYTALRARLASTSGPQYWRSLEELAGTQEIDALVHREFPSQAGEILDPVSRRGFMKVMGASMMMAGLASCSRQPEETIVPYVKPPEETIPGKANYYATAMPLAGYGMGLLAVSYEGRPTRLEGLPEHPSSLGATDAHAQASILDMYSPDRLDVTMHGGHISTWVSFQNEATQLLTKLDAVAGAGLHILTGTVTSPTLVWQLQKLLAKYPKATWNQFEPLGRDSIREGARLAFGEYVDTVYDFTKAKVVLSLDANFLEEGVGHVRYARDFAASRDVDVHLGNISRLYVAESAPTLTGASADHKLNLRYHDVETLARLVAEQLGIAGVAPAEEARATVAANWLGAVVNDLKAAAGGAVVLAGEQQPAIVHAIAHAINTHLGSDRSGLVQYVEPVEASPVNQLASVRSLVEAMNAGQVACLVMLGGNPVYDTPADLNFAEALNNVAVRVHYTADANETTRLSHWAIPATHYLESWGDVRGHDGTISIVQPLILPMYAGKTVHEVMSVLLGEENINPLEIVKSSWIARRGPDGFDAFWKTALGKGVVDGTAAAPKPVKHLLQFAAQQYVPTPAATLDIVFRLDPKVLDGQFANNGWLQELPAPLTRLTWDNALFLHPKTAHRLNVKHEDLVELECNGRTVRCPVMVQIGHPQDVGTVHLGYGRTHAGKIGTGVGFNAYSIQTADSPWFATGANVRPTGRTHMLARTEEHWNIEQSLVEQGEVAERRHLIREATVATFLENKEFAKTMGHPAPADSFTLYQPEEKEYVGGEYTGYAWGMTIDLNKCTGCNVCTVACQAENNIPIVGKEQVRMGREMHWIRVDRYYKGDFEGDAQVSHQPVPCMQCENAPCEPVCPVGATMHSKEGLNDMVYNRCVGTRYCANNCPYKVRRFNFFHFNIREGQDAPSLKMMRNPNVTVRSRGVMEKCTYCVQRINAARIDAKRKGTRIEDGAIVVACQSACPSSAIQFGDIRNPQSKVAEMKQNPRNYALLGDIGTRPRTTYLARVTNPSPALAGEANVAAPHGGNHSEH